MRNDCPTGVRILVVAMALFVCVALVVGLWRPDRMTYAGHMHPQAWLGRLLVVMVCMLYLAILVMAWKGRLWAWYVLSTFFAWDLTQQIVGRNFLIGNMIIDLCALAVLVVAIYNRHAYNAWARRREQGDG